MTTTRITITVTEEDIKQGERGRCNGCPLSIAISRAVGRRVFVDGFGAYINQNPYWTVLSVPLRLWIGRFDKNLSVSPITFELDVPDEWLEKEAA